MYMHVNVDIDRVYVRVGSDGDSSRMELLFC
jgi:hypothetical protein